MFEGKVQATWMMSLEPCIKLGEAGAIGKPAQYMVIGMLICEFDNVIVMRLMVTESALPSLPLGH